MTVSFVKKTKPYPHWEYSIPEFDSLIKSVPERGGLITSWVCNREEILYDSFNIFNINLNYFIFKIKDKENVIRIKNDINFNDIEKTKNILQINNIEFEYFKKRINNPDKIHYKIKEDIILNQNYFFIIEDEYILFGEIIKNLKIILI